MDDTWHHAALAARLLALDPGLGGIALRARAGPVRDAYVQGLGRQVKLHPGMGDDVLSGGVDLTATLAGGQIVTRPGLLQPGAPLLLVMAERCTTGFAARLTQHLDTHGGPLVALDEGADADEGLPDALRDRLAFHLDFDGLAHTVTRRFPDSFQTRSARHRPGDIALICGLAADLGVTSLRAPTLALRAARAHARLQGRDETADEDITIAAKLVLAPRATQFPLDEPPPPPPPDEEPESDTNKGEQTLPQDLILEAIRAILPDDLLDRAAARRAGQGQGHGSGAARKGNRRGRPLPSRAGQKSDATRIDVIATLRTAAPWQALRKTPARTGLQIRKSDIQIKRFEEKSDRLLIFAVDASGSAALARLAEAKGAVELLLAQAYARRDHVALVSFRGQEAELLLPPTRSLVQTKRRLASLPGGGGTPLAAGLEQALTQAILAKRRGLTPTICLLTDGRANVARDGRGDRAQAAADAASAARLIVAQGVESIVIDTGNRPTQDLRALSQTLGGVYLPLPRADARRLSQAVQSALDG